MGLNIAKFWMIYFDGGDSTFMYSDFASIDEKEIKKYEKKHPFPKDEKFSFEDLLGYHTNCSDEPFCMMDDVSQDVANWVLEMIEELFEY